MTDTKTTETTPDQLMKTFEGRSLKSVIIFTVVVHAALLFGTSVPYLFRTFTGADTSAMSEEERLSTAAKEATAAIREIAERYDLKPQELGSRFADGTPKDAATPATGEGTTATEAPPADETNEPDSVIEQEIQKVEEGPELPPVEDEDLFK